MTQHLDVNLVNGIAFAFEGDAASFLVHCRHPIFQGQTANNCNLCPAVHVMSGKGGKLSLIEKC